jgi:hypothetical protein
MHVQNDQKVSVSVQMFSLLHVRLIQEYSYISVTIQNFSITRCWHTAALSLNLSKP